MLNASQNYQLPCNMPFLMCIDLTNLFVQSTLTALKECSISYHDKTESTKRASAPKRQQQRLVSSIPTDPIKIATHGPTVADPGFQKGRLSQVLPDSCPAFFCNTRYN